MSMLGGKPVSVDYLHWKPQPAASSLHFSWKHYSTWSNSWDENSCELWQLSQFRSCLNRKRLRLCASSTQCDLHSLCASWFCLHLGVNERVTVSLSVIAAALSHILGSSLVHACQNYSLSQKRWISETRDCRNNQGWFVSLSTSENQSFQAFKSQLFPPVVISWSPI